jgi:DNA-binding NarL/FixJ family response regulator
MSQSARILFISMHADRTYVEEAFRAGAYGYVLKQEAAGELVQAIHSVMRGHYYVSSMLGGEAAIPAFSPLQNPAKLVGGRLTPRQREVLQLVAEGKSMKEIGSVLQISARTVEFHKSSIMRELGVRTTAELTRYALSQGIAIP